MSSLKKSKSHFSSHPGIQERAYQQPYAFDFLLPLTWQQVFFCDEPQQPDIKKIKFEFMILISGKRQFWGLDIIYFLDKSRINQPLNRFIILPCPCIFIDSGKTESFIFPSVMSSFT